jgi:hypothetical protein
MRISGRDAATVLSGLEDPVLDLQNGQRIQSIYSFGARPSQARGMEAPEHFVVPISEGSTHVL